MRPTKLFYAALVILSVTACNEASEEKTVASDSVTATIKEENLNYSSDSLQLNGYIVYKDSMAAKRPGIIVVPEWWGLNDYARNRAKQLADMGYVAMAIDMYGNGQTASTPDEAKSLAGPFYADPNLGKSRLDAAIAKLKTNPQVDTSQVVAIGYCFGGAMVLNSAKLGSDLEGVVSFHGGLAGPAPDKNKLKARILVCHGAADSFVPDADSLAFRNGLDSIGAEYTFKSYANAKHAFTNPQADENARKYKLDIAYNAAADSASWQDMKDFFGRIFK